MLFAREFLFEFDVNIPFAHKYDKEEYSPADITCLSINPMENSFNRLMLYLSHKSYRCLNTQSDEQVWRKCGRCINASILRELLLDSMGQTDIDYKFPKEVQTVQQSKKYFFRILKVTGGT